MRHLGLHAILRTLLILFLITIMTGLASAQFVKGFSVGWGLKTTEILGSNPAAAPFSESDPNKPALFGGGFDGPQQGMELLFEFPVGENNDFFIPLGIDYSFYQGLQRIPQNKFILQSLENRLDVASLSLGLNYAVLKYSIANAKIYAGLEAKTSFIGQNTFTVETEYKQHDSVEIFIVDLKESCVRLGGSIKIGIEGEIADNWYVNILGTFGIMNLIGRNNERGELMTPYKKTYLSFENRESFLYTIQYSFIIQYKL
ncbi:MAG: hypothetical protein HZB41_09140 [Ignavibacteriae bacterium]|nr:hypothetical protein [Ignavibacteriota bacterium]